ncbi:MAG: Ig domain-containing protein [Opitutaceae bacterium]
MKHLFFSFLSLLLLSGTARAQDFLCAEVKIEILQELTLERQAFEARMRIINGLELPLNNIDVQVVFTDADGDPVIVSSDPDDPNPNVKFFITENAPGVPGSVTGSSDNRFTWLIIPTVDSGGELPSGQQYNVGAILTYTVGSESDEERVEVAPDAITVLPLPELALDYFLPVDVYGDNPDTTYQIEPSTPFSLGVRIKNIGFGTASSVKIDSAQPRIVENDLGLLINFVITGSEINDVVAPNSLLIDFGDIAPATTGFAATARWIMEASLSGRFTEFDATVSHSDELGGDLTALISNENLNTHKLLREVQVDLTGSDTRMDFLSCERDDPTFVEVYESDGTETRVNYPTAGTTPALTPSGGDYAFTVVGDAGFTYAKYVDPHEGDMELESVVRSDGKVLRSENVWLHREWDKDADVWDYYFSFFDGANQGAGTYTVSFKQASLGQVPPVMQYMVDRTVTPGEQVGIIVVATDLNSGTVELSVEGAPSGSTFTEQVRASGRSTNFFTWTPTESQTGTAAVTFTATDSTGRSDSQVVHIFVIGDDSSGFDAFIARHFGDETDLAIIGPDADPDFDSMTNLAEYGQNTNPLLADRELGPQVGVEEFDGEFYLTLTYRKRMDDSELVFTVAGTSGIAQSNSRTVQSTTVLIDQEDLPDGLERVKVRDSVPLGSSANRRYLELTVTQTPSEL